MAISNDAAGESSVLKALLSKLLPDPVKDLIEKQDLADEIRGRQVLSVKRMTPLMLLANSIILIGTVFVLAGTVNNFVLAAWASFTIAIIFAGMWNVKFRWKINSVAHPRKSTSRVVSNSAMLAIVWGALPVLFFDGASTEQKVFIACIASGMMGGGTMALSIVPKAAAAFCFAVGTGAMWALLTSMDSLLWASALLLMTYGVALVRISHEQGTRYVERFLDEQELKEQRATIGMLLKDFEDSSSDWMWETDAKGRIVAPSERFCESIGMSQAALEGRAFKSFVSLPQAKDSCELKKTPLVKKLETETSFRDHVVQIDTNVGPRWWNLAGKPLTNGEGKLTGFRGTASDVNEWKHAQDRLNNMARYDQITGLSNRNHFYEVLTEDCKKLNSTAKKAGATEGETFAVLYLGLDRFKIINDSLGHSIGDALLRETANRLQQCLKPGDLAARFGGDEFAILHRSGHKLEASQDLASSILAHLSRPFLIQGHTVSLSGSIGICLSTKREVEAEALLRNADLALYRAKADGGGGFEVFQPGMDQALLNRRALEVDLRSALKERQFVLYYQPLTNVDTGRTSTYEALIRWNHPTRGLLQPDDFIPLSEETGLINDIGDWVLEQACQDAARWSTPHRVAINISARQIMSQRLLMRIMEVLKTTGLEPERLELEVTESVLIENPERTRKLFVELRKMGIGISLDDFGTGYSSLSYLVRFPFDKVKIDKSFIQAAEESEEDLAIIRSILGLAGNLGIRTTAEGIESATQLQIVKREGCDEMQGFLIEKPKPMSEIPGLARRLRKPNGKQSAA